MGSMISLGIEKMEIDWGKNNIFRDHSALFKASDVKEIPYYYVDLDSDDTVVEMKEGYARSLSSIKHRLDLLGYDLKSIRRMYDETVQDHSENGYHIKLSFDSYYEIISAINISEIDTVQYAAEYDENGYDFGEFVRRCIFSAHQIRDKILIEYEEDYEDEYRDPETDLSEFLENLDPYIMLRILAENPNNNQEVRWSYADVVENGWVSRNSVVKGLESGQQILIVTEGSSDSFVLREAIDQLYPDISDFFNFIDMKDNYPFTGTGNLYNFCVGLCKINILNNVIVIFDNDTAGQEKYQQSISLKKPESFLITTLPNSKEFEKVSTLGPQGKTVENINGRAVAIECFLDFSSVEGEPSIRWTTYNKNMKQYQGEIVHKDEYVRMFKQANLLDGSYNVDKLKYLIDYVIACWINRERQ